MLQGIAGVPVLLFQRAHLLILVGQAHLQLAKRLVEAGAAQLFGLQGALGGKQFFRFGGQCGHIDLMLLMRRSQCLLGNGQL
ncbi:hypothetical protein D3C77_767140 [compost metagenome]